VKEEAFRWDPLLGMDAPALREASHSLDVSYGMPFCLPSYKMGESGRL